MATRGRTPYSTENPYEPHSIQRTETQRESARRGRAAAYGVAGGLAEERAGYEDRQAPTQERVGVGREERIVASQAGGGEFEAQRQRELADALREQAAGRGPSLAALQAQQGAEAATKQAMALAATGRGNVGAALGRAQQAAGEATTAAAGQAMQGWIQEQLAAREQLAGVLATSRGQDVQAQQFNAQLAQAAAAGNQQAANQMTVLRAELAQRAAQGDQSAALQMAALDDVMKQALLAGELSGLGVATGGAAPGAPKPGAWQQYGLPALQAGVTTAAATAPYWAPAVAASDERVKTDIAPLAGGDADEFLQALEKSSHYRYKEPSVHGEGERAGPMAQGLERTRIGKGIVREDAGGTKVLDLGAFVTALSAAVGHLNRKVEARG